MRIIGIYNLNQVFGFEVYQDQKQPRHPLGAEKRTTYSTHKWRLLPPWLWWKTSSLNRWSNRSFSSSPILQCFLSVVTGYFLNMEEEMSFNNECLRGIVGICPVLVGGLRQCIPLFLFGKQIVFLFQYWKIVCGQGSRWIYFMLFVQCIDWSSRTCHIRGSS